MRCSLVTSLLLAFCIADASAVDYLRDEAGVAGLRFGACLSGLEDQNGDGAWELLVGAPGYQAAGQAAGRAYLWFGGMALHLNADRILTGTGVEQFGHAVSRVGDVNGDGTADFAIGAPYANNAGSEAGRVYLFYGDDPLPTAPDLVLEGPAANGHFGWSIAPLGDFNGDGRDDFVVGAPTTNTYGLEAGAAYVFYGQSGDPHPTPDLTLAGNRAYEHFGWSVAGVADFLGGNASCLAVGAPSHDTSGTAIEGLVYVYQGTTSPSPGPNATADLTLASSSTSIANNEFGFSVAGIGSYDGDPDPDLAVGIPFFSGSGIDAGRVEVFFGGLDADATSDRYANGPAANSHFGWSVAGVGQVDGSGAPDVLIGAPYDDAVASNAGRAFVLVGGAGNVNDADSLPVVDRGAGLAPDTAAADLFGTWCTWAGDFDGDGLDDYAVGAPDGNVTSAAVAGWLRFQDSSGAAVPALLGAWSCAWTADGGVLGSLALGMPGTGIERVTVTRRDEHGTALSVLHDGPPAAGSAVWLAGRNLWIRDANAAYQTDGVVRYALAIALVEETQPLRADLAGPGGAAPAAPVLLSPAYPNPFNPRTVLACRAPAGTPLAMRVFDLRGRLVRTLLEGAATGAWQEAVWDGRDGRGATQAAGVYQVRLATGREVRTVRVVLAK